METVLAAGQSMVFDVRDFIRMTIITDATGVATVSRVKDMQQTAHTTGAKNQFTVAADSRHVQDVDAPFYLVSVATAGCRVLLV